MNRTPMGNLVLPRPAETRAPAPAIGGAQILTATTLLSLARDTWESRGTPQRDNLMEQLIDASRKARRDPVLATCAGLEEARMIAKKLVASGKHDPSIRSLAYELQAATL